MGKNGFSVFGGQEHQIFALYLCFPQNYFRGRTRAVFNTHLKRLNVTIGASLPINAFPLFTENNTILYLLNITFEINGLRNTVRIIVKSYLEITTILLYKKS